MLGHSRYSRHNASSRSLSRSSRSPYPAKQDKSGKPSKGIDLLTKAKVKKVSMLKHFLPSEAEMRMLLHTNEGYSKQSTKKLEQPEILHNLSRTDMSDSQGVALLSQLQHLRKQAPLKSPGKSGNHKKIAGGLKQLSNSKLKSRSGRSLNQTSSQIKVKKLQGMGSTEKDLNFDDLSMNIHVVNEPVPAKKTARRGRMEKLRAKSSIQSRQIPEKELIHLQKVQSTQQQPRRVPLSKHQTSQARPTQASQERVVSRTKSAQGASKQDDDYTLKQLVAHTKMYQVAKQQSQIPQSKASLERQLHSKVSQIQQNYYKAVCEEQQKNKNAEEMVNQKHADDFFKKSIETRSFLTASRGEEQTWNASFHRPEVLESAAKKKRNELGNAYMYSRQSIKKPGLNSSMITPQKPETSFDTSFVKSFDQPRESKKSIESISKLSPTKRKEVSATRSRSAGHFRRSTVHSAMRAPKSTEQKMALIYKRLGAIVRGYKCRKIYNSNKVIKKYRLEFRDLIQFAYSLKQEINHAQEISDGEPSLRIQQTKQLLLTSLKELIQKRQQFSDVFHLLLRKSLKEVEEFTQVPPGNPASTKVHKNSELQGSFQYNSNTTFAPKQSRYNTKDSRRNSTAGKKANRKQFINTGKSTDNLFKKQEKIQTKSHQTSCQSQKPSPNHSKKPFLASIGGGSYVQQRDHYKKIFSSKSNSSMHSRNEPDQKEATSTSFNILCKKNYNEELKSAYAQEVTGKRKQQLTFGNNTQVQSKRESPNGKMESKRSSQALLTQFRQFITGQSSREPYENLKSQKAQLADEGLLRSKSQATYEVQQPDLMEELTNAFNQSPVRKLASRESSIRLSSKMIPSRRQSIQSPMKEQKPKSRQQSPVKQPQIMSRPTPPTPIEEEPAITAPSLKTPDEKQVMAEEREKSPTPLRNQIDEKVRDRSRSYLRRGQKTRSVYDPEKSIREERERKKSQPMKQVASRYQPTSNQTTEEEEPPVLKKQQSILSDFKLENKPAPRHNFMREEEQPKTGPLAHALPRPYSKAPERSTSQDEPRTSPQAQQFQQVQTPTKPKNFLKENIRRVSQLSCSKKRLPSQLKQDPSVSPTKPEQRGRATEEEEKKPFVSKIPRLSCSRGRQTSITRVTPKASLSNIPSIGKQSFPRLSKELNEQPEKHESPIRPSSQLGLSSNSPTKKPSPQIDNAQLKEMMEKIRKSNCQYVKNELKQESPEPSPAKQQPFVRGSFNSRRSIPENDYSATETRPIWGKKESVTRAPVNNRYNHKKTFSNFSNLSQLHAGDSSSKAGNATNSVLSPQIIDIPVTQVTSANQVEFDDNQSPLRKHLSPHHPVVPEEVSEEDQFQDVDCLNSFQKLAKKYSPSKRIDFYEQERQKAEKSKQNKANSPKRSQYSPYSQFYKRIPLPEVEISDPTEVVKSPSPDSKSRLQQFIQQFSPLRNQSFENQYIRRRRDNEPGIAFKEKLKEKREEKSRGPASKFEIRVHPSPSPSRRQPEKPESPEQLAYDKIKKELKKEPLPVFEARNREFTNFNSFSPSKRGDDTHSSPGARSSNPFESKHLLEQTEKQLEMMMDEAPDPLLRVSMFDNGHKGFDLGASSEFGGSRTNPCCNLKIELAPSNRKTEDLEQQAEGETPQLGPTTTDKYKKESSQFSSFRISPQEVANLQSPGGSSFVRSQIPSAKDHLRITPSTSLNKTDAPWYGVCDKANKENPEEKALPKRRPRSQRKQGTNSSQKPSSDPYMSTSNMDAYGKRAVLGSLNCNRIAEQPVKDYEQLSRATRPSIPERKSVLQQRFDSNQYTPVKKEKQRSAYEGSYSKQSRLSLPQQQSAAKSPGHYKTFTQTQPSMFNSISPHSKQATPVKNTYQRLNCQKRSQQKSRGGDRLPQTMTTIVSQQQPW